MLNPFYKWLYQHLDAKKRKADKLAEEEQSRKANEFRLYMLKLHQQQKERLRTAKSTRKGKTIYL